MFKNLLVVLEETPEVVTAYAVSLAKRLEARVTVIRPRRDAAGLSDGSIEARLELARGDYETRKARAKEAVEAFGDKAKEAGVEAELLFPDEGADPRRDSVAAFARVFDFAIVGQPEPGRAAAPRTRSLDSCSARAVARRWSFPRSSAAPPISLRSPSPGTAARRRRARSAMR